VAVLGNRLFDRHPGDGVLPVALLPQSHVQIMNEDIPPFPPKKPVGPEMPSVPTSPPRVGLNPFLGFGLGVFLFVVSLFGGSPIVLLIGLIGAVASLFYRGQRSIFLGYILTVGVTLLAVIIYRSTHPFDMK
jgi:hypothetical protein